MKTSDKLKRKPLHIMECHVKGYTQMCPYIPKYKRGKFLGLCDKFMIEHLKKLDINTLQIMPVFLSKDTYWNYDTLDYFTLNPEFGTLSEFKHMLNTLQSKGIKVVLDIVVTHTHHEADIEGIYYTKEDMSGCGNSVDCEKSLPYLTTVTEYWLRDVGVDGFRLDLGAICGVEGGVFKKDAKFFKMLEGYPDKTFITEPYGCMCHYELGNFPEWMYELNGKFCKATRKGHTYWCEDDLPWERSVNFIASHDGFCAVDAVSYERKHNEHNGESNNDGDNDNASYSHGVEGDTNDPNTLSKRKKHLSRMFWELYNYSYNWLLLAGDELGNTQEGCNNNYLVDDERVWVSWDKYKEYFGGDHG
jgi:pullulanase/glycogen debranching enzyme